MSGIIEQGTNTGVKLLTEVPSGATLITSGYVYSGFSTPNSSQYDYVFSSCVNNLYPANQNSNSLAGPLGPTGTNDPTTATSISGTSSGTGLIMQLFDSSGFPVNDKNNYPIQIQYIPNYTQNVQNATYNNDLFMMVSYSKNSVNNTLNFESTGTKSFLSGTQGFTMLPSYLPTQDRNTIGKTQTQILNSIEPVGGVLSFPSTPIILEQPAGTGLNYNTDNYYLYFVASSSDPNPFINGQITNSGKYSGQGGSSGYFELYYN
jgi:hypothetical protein